MSDDYGPKLNTTVVVATSEAEAFPASSLERHTARTKGWHSAKMSEYPLDIVFAFDGLAEIQCVRLLSHESKIPAKVDLYVFTPSEDDIARGAYPPVETADFRRLGYINFSTNEASNFCARELKTVRVKARVQYLKLSIRGCHANGVNVFNQAGLVAADFHGTLLAPYPHTARQALLGSRSAMNPDSLDAEVALSDLTPVKAPSSATGTTRRRVEDQAGGAGALERQQSSSRPGTASMSNFDSITAQRIKQLMLFKAKAVAEEDYDLAKALKTQIDQLQAVGERIAELEEAKRVAVDQEDYDAAKVLKRQIDELRNPKPPAPPQPQAAAPAHYGATAAPSLAPIYAPAPYEHGEGAAPAHNTRTSPLYGNDDVPVGGGGGGRAVPYDEQPAVARGRGNQMSEYPDEGPSGGFAAAARSRSNPRDAHDEKLAVATGAADDETGGIVVGNKQPAAAGRTVPIEQEGMPAWERQFNLRIVALAGAEEGHAPPLEGSKLKEYQEFTTAFGLYGMSCLFAKKWQLRDAALRAIVDKEGFAALTSSQRSPSQGNPTSNLMVLLSYLDGKTTGVNDSIAQVFFTVCDVIKAIVGEDLPGVPVVAALSGLTNLLPAMLMKAGDSNQRVREKAQTTLLMLAMSPVGTERVANAALHDPQEKSKKPLNYRVHEARLAILRVLVSKVGVNTKAARTGLAPDAIVQRLCIPMLGHASGDVRDAAMQLIITLYEHVPNAQTMDALLKDIKPAQKVAIDELRGGGGGAKEPEIASSSIHVERGGNHPVLEAARQAKGEPAAAPAAAAKGGATKDPSAAARQQQQRDEALREAQTCQFCGKYDPRFTDATLDAHYARTCPMLCPCPHCHQITEIPTLQQHLVAECNRSTAVKQCPTCREAVHAAEFDEHVAAASCIPFSTSYHVCPLCHVKLPPTDQGWDDHLLKAPGCVNNPRRYDGGSGEEFK